MKKLFSLLIICLLVQVLVKAQSKEEKDVAAAVEKLRLAMISGNKSQLEGIAAKELSYGHSSGKIENKTAFVQAFLTKESDFVTIDLTDQTISIVGNNAIVRHNLLATTNNSGVPGTTKLGVLLVWQKQQGQWKLLARQAFKIP